MGLANERIDRCRWGSCRGVSRAGHPRCVGRGICNAIRITSPADELAGGPLGGAPALVPWIRMAGYAVSRKLIIRLVGVVTAAIDGIALGWMVAVWDHDKPAPLAARAVELLESHSALAPSDNPLEAFHVSDEAKKQPTAGAPARARDGKIA